MNTHFFIISWNHQQTPLQFREMLSLNGIETKKFIQSSLKNQSIFEIAVLSTCNRIEFHVVSENVNDVLDAIKKAYHDVMCRQVSWNAYSPMIVTDFDAFKHSCLVSAGLESMVFGEVQIASQVEVAHEILMETQPHSKILANLLLRSIECSRKIRHAVGDQGKSISVSGLVLEKVKDEFINLEECSVLIIGAGQSASLTAQLFKDNGINKIFIVNRNEQNGKILSENVSGRFMKMEDLAHGLQHCNVLVSATHSNQYLVNRKQIELAMNQGKDRFLLFDISSPRNLDPCISEVENVHLHDLDTLNPRVLDKKQHDRKILNKAELIIKEHSLDLMSKIEFGKSINSKVELEEANF